MRLKSVPTVSKFNLGVYTRRFSAKLFVILKTNITSNVFFSFLKIKLNFTTRIICFISFISANTCAFVFLAVFFVFFQNHISAASNLLLF